MIEVEISDGTIVEFPDEMSQDDIKSVLQKKFPVTQSFAPSLPQEEIVQKYFGAPPAAPVQAPPPLFDESMRQVPMRTTTGTTPTPMMAYDLPPEERRAQFKEDILTPAVPLPRLTIDPKESPVTAAGKEAVNVLIGVPEFVETPAGILSFGAAAIAPIVTAGGFTVDMLYNLGKQIKTAYGNWDKMTPAEKTVAVVDMAGTGAFAALTGTAAGRGIQRRLEPPQMKATRELARVLETTEPLGTVQSRQPIRQLGIPQAALTAEPFLQPGIPELAGQALREAQSPLTVPGRTLAIEMLRSELAPPEVVPVESRLAGRIPERGGTMVTPTLEGVQVQPRVLRSASDILLERFVGREPLPIPPEVQATVRPQPELERKPDVTQPSETVLQPEPKEATTPAQEVLETGEAKPSTRQLLPEARKKLLKYEEHSANALAKGNELAENGNESKAEEFYQLSSRWLMRANELREDAKNYVKEQPTPSAKVEAPPAEPPGAPREMRPSPYWLEDVTAPSVETVRAQRALEQRQAEAESAKTAISRGERVSEPTQWLVSDNGIGGLVSRTNQRILHHGSGKASADTEALRKLKNVREVVEYDPTYAPNADVLGKQDFDQVVSNYVLNTLPPAARRNAIIDIGTSMTPSVSGVDYGKGGVAWITVRGGGDVIKGVASEDGVVTSKGTWQRNYTPEQIRAELEPYFKHVKIDKGNTKSSKSTTVIVQDYIGPVREAGISAPDLISKLESLKLPETGEGNLYSLPHPDAIKAIGISTWNSAVEIAIASVKAGKAFAKAIDDAIAYLRKNVRGLDEARARANLEYVAREEIKPTVQIPSTEGETIKMRKSAERATTSPMVPEPVQERIAKAPESFYPQQVMKRVEEVVGDMTDQNLAAVPKDSNLYTASRLELARRLFERNDNEAGYRVFEDLEREGTRMGQLINQFKLLKGTRPENVVRVINEKLKREGKDVLNEKQRQEALEKATVSKQKDAVLDKATNDWQQNPTVENAAIAEKALLESHQAAVDLQRFVSRFSPRSTASILKSILQGNLLTPISETANIFGNISFLPFRGMTRTVATAFDVLDNALTKTPREIMVQPIAGTGQAMKGLGVGVSQMPAILKRGTGDVIKGETRAGLHPLQAWINQFSSNPEMPTTGGKPTLQDRVNLAIEGTLGVPAEVMLRGLGVGDIAFKEAARARVTAEQLKLANVPRDQWSFAQKFPEFFLNEAAMERVQAETMAAVFQRSSRTLNVFTNWLKGKGEIADLLAAFVAPYKLTPWNIIGETLSYNPLVAFGRTLYELKQGNRRSAKLNAAKYVVGSMITGAGWWLYSKGLMSPSLDERDESQKARVAAGEVMPPNHINVSGLKRALEGGDPAFKTGDETVDVFRAGGLAGSMFYMTANIGRDFERRPEVPSSEIWLAILRQSTLEQARFGLNQSFLSGVEGLLTAIKEGNAENYVQKLANTVTSVPLPNSLTVLSRASREFKPDFHGDTFWKQMENVFRNKLGWAGMDDYLPLKRDLWGEPIPETPEGRNAIIYHFFDITKNRQVTSDPAKLELFRLWRKTADNRIFPSIPERQITVQSKNYPLNSEQYSRYAELVGKERKRILDAVSVNPQFHKLSDEAKVAGLDRIYRAGLDAGKAKFWKERGATLTPKPPRAGFAPAP